MTYNILLGSRASGKSYQTMQKCKGKKALWVMPTNHFDKRLVEYNIQMATFNKVLASPWEYIKYEIIVIDDLTIYDNNITELMYLKDKFQKYGFKGMIYMLGNIAEREE